MSLQVFNSLGVSDKLCAALKREGIVSPTPVQQQAIPSLLRGADLIAQAQTGTGKTLAFALPILEQIQVDKAHTQALILTPTRELAIQIYDEIKKYAGKLGISVLAAYGGQDVDAQIRRLANAPHIITATPGRLIDHMNRGTVNLGKLSMLVLDEADQMLHMGFLPEVESIITQTPKSRQTMLFSATMPDPIRRLAKQYMNEPQDVRVIGENVTLDNIKQIAVETSARNKERALIHLLDTHRPYLAVIFCRTKIRAKKLNESLQNYGFQSDELHGDLTQAKREQVMKRFRDAKLQVLVATDVAARGLDVEGVTHVYNYDMPPDTEHYIHRIGRTGRAGQTGMAVTMITPYDLQSLSHLEKRINTTLRRTVVDHSGTIQTVGSKPKEQKEQTAKPNYRNNKGKGTKGSNRQAGKATIADRPSTARENSANPWQKAEDVVSKGGNRKRSARNSSAPSGKSKSRGSAPQARSAGNRQESQNSGGRRGGRSTRSTGPRR